MTQPTKQREANQQPPSSAELILSESSADDGRIQAIVQNAVGATSYAHWFHGRTRFQVTGSKLCIFVASPFLVSWMQRQFRAQLAVAANAAIGPDASVSFEVDAGLLTSTDDREPSAGIAPEPDNAHAHLENADVSETEHVGTAIAKVTRRAGRRDQAAAPITAKRRYARFSGSVIGDCNDIAFAAARKVADAPGERLNPLFIHGPTGTGKTHLLECIYSHLRAHHPALNVIFLTSEAFTNYFTGALVGKTLPSFRQRFRAVDVLLIDDVDFLDNKRGIQEELLHTVSQLLSHGGQVVVTADRHPRLLKRLREELATRFVSGLVARVESPDAETRLKIVKQLVTTAEATFTRDAIQYVADRFRRNIRELQGAVNCLDSHASLADRKVTARAARKTLGELEQACLEMIRISDIEKAVCAVFELKPTLLRSATRRQAVSRPRMLAMYLARKLTKAPYREIGEHFGGRDHSTVKAAELRVKEWLNNGQEVRFGTQAHTMEAFVREVEDRIQLAG